MSNLKSTLFASVGAAAMLLAPLAILPANSLPAGYAALAEKGGNGKGNGNGGGGSENRGNSGNAEKHEEKAAAREEAKADKTKNLNSQLGRLNSLKRNVNGLMNSSDPHMAGVRDYVKANAALDAAEAALTVAQGNYDLALSDYETLVGGMTFGGYDGFIYPDSTLATLAARLTTLEGAPITDPADPLYAAYTAEVASLQAVVDSEQATTLGTATTALGGAQDDVTAATVGTTDADLQAALVAAANKDGEITPEILAWAKTQLGID